MKINTTKRVLALLLTLTMLLPSLAGMTLTAQADTGYTTASAKVYDLYDLAGATSKTIFGRVQTGTWDQEIGRVAEADKGNVAFTTKMTVGSSYEHIFIGLGMSGANASSTSDGYIFEIQAKTGEPDAVVYHKKDAPWQASSQGLTFDFNGTYVLEAGVVDLYQDGVLAGKRAYLKANGEEICHWDDTNPVTTENLGTVVGVYNEQNNITMESTYNMEFGTETVYDIYDLTGATANTINGTGNGNWSATVLGNIDTADKENVSFKANVNIADEAKYRFSLGALESDDCVDPAGYGFELNVGASGYIAFVRGSSHTWIKGWTEDTTALKGEYELEFGYRDITLGSNVIGKQIFLKKNGEVLYTYDDMSGYLTGDALGTKVALFHYGTAVQMNSTYENGYGSANVYDIADLTGATAKNVNAWESTKIGSVSAEHKEQVAVKFHMNMTDARHRYRFSVGAQEGADCTDLKGYGLEIGIQFDGQNYVRFQRNSDWIAVFNDVSGVLGEHDFEFGYRNITFGNNIIGKQVYLSVDGVDLYTYDDASGYLTGDALGTMVALHHIDDAAVQLESTYEIGYGTEKVYDISDLTGADSNSFNGTGNGNWSASVFGNVDAADKEGFSIKANVSITDGNEFRLSLGALDSKDCVDVTAYGLVLHFGMSKLVFARNGNWDISWDMNNADMMGEYELEFGYRSITLGSRIIGKQIFVKKNGEVLHTYDNLNDYLTGDALGTKVALFHYGTVVEMNTAKECSHNYSSETTNPDCVNAGKTVYACTLCGDTYEETIDALGHTEVIDAAVSADCNNPGKTEGSHCSVCNEVIVAQNEVPALGHSYVAETTPADCTNDGKTVYTCSVCGDTYEEVIPAGHAIEHVPEVIPANCQETGHSEYWYCSACDCYFGDAEASYQVNPAWINYTGEHVRPEDAIVCAVVPCELCGEDSYGEACDRGDAPVCQDAPCVNCGETVFGWGCNYNTGDEEVPLPLCQPGDCVYCGTHYDKLYDCENGSWAPCSVDGECAYGCGKQYPATGVHQLDDPCAGGTCWLCWETIEGAHSYVAVTTPADCTNDGKIVYTCSVCSDSYEEAIPAGHAIEHVPEVIPANCQETGHSEYWYCSACDCYFGDAEASYQVNPAWINYTGEHVRPEGSIVCAVVKCELCGEDSYGEACDRGDAPVCQDAPCVNCGETVFGWGCNYNTGDEEVPLPLCQPGDCVYCGTHYDKLYDCENGSWAPCSVDGECAYGCGKQYPATGEHMLDDPCAGGTCWQCWNTIEGAHSYESVVTPPTAIKEGYTTHTCSVCGDSYVDSNVPAIGIGELKISGADLTLYNNLCINFNVDANLFVEDAYTNPYVVCSFGNKTMTISNYTVGDGKYVFTCDGISPSQIGDVVNVTLYATLNGEEQAAATVEYGVAAYCYNMLAKTEDAELKTLLVDLLNYGAAAQNYANYKNGSLCNADLTEEQKSWGTQVAPAVSSVLNTKYATVENAKATWKAASVYLENTISMRFRFAAESIDGLSVKVVIAGQEFVINEFVADSAHAGQYYVYFNGMTASQLRETVYVTVCEGDTAVSNTVTYSVESYACNKQNDSNAKLVALLEAIMKYGDAAYAFKY